MVKNMKKWNLFNISKSRDLLFGIAVILVVFYHCYDLKFEYVGILRNIKNIGNIGVDIFLYLSAIGLYFSFTNNPNIKEFYKRRFKRIIPCTLIVAVIYYIYKGVNLLDFLKGVSLLSFYIDGSKEFWFFSFIIPLYVLFPLLYKLINKYGLKILIPMVIFIISITLFIMEFSYNTYYNYQIALTRIPIFLIGIYTGKYVYEKKEISNIWMLVFLSLFIECNILLFGFNMDINILSWYIYCVLGISIVFLISYIYSNIKIKLIDKLFIKLGTYSLEIYLLFEKLGVELSNNITISNKYIYYLIVFIITLLLSFLLKKINNIKKA